MLKKNIIFMLSAFFFFGLSLFCVNAECEHDFSLSEGNVNIIYNSDMSHSYYCRKGCGKYGTVSGGLNGKESCSYYLVSSEEPSCVADGKATYACSVCYRNKVERLKAVEHSYYKIRMLPTCTRQGYDIYTCTVCGDSYCDNYRETLEHISDKGIVETLPTYDKEGAVNVSCRVCGTHIETVVLDRFVREGEHKPALGKVSNIKCVKSSASAIKLTWDKTDGADAYKISFSTDKKLWKTLTTDKNYVTVKNLKPARRYYLKVTAVSKGTDGAEGVIVSVCTKPSKTVLIKVKSLKNKSVTIRWKKLDNVSGYEISYTADSFSKKKSVKTAAVTKGTSKTLGKLKRGKKYRFRVRAYKNFGSRKIYGAYSKVLSIRIR